LKAGTPQRSPRPGDCGRGRRRNPSSRSWRNRYYSALRLCQRRSWCTGARISSPPHSSSPKKNTPCFPGFPVNTPSTAQSRGRRGRASILHAGEQAAKGGPPLGSYFVRGGKFDPLPRRLGDLNKSSSTWSAGMQCPQLRIVGRTGHALAAIPTSALFMLVSGRPAASPVTGNPQAHRSTGARGGGTPERPR
jgi:hypothetical protein